MTPPAAAATARTRSHTRRATPPRRVSGPVRGRAVPAGAIAGPPPLALRLGGAVHGIAEHRWLDRIVRGRAWIGILAFGLLGIVFMQVSMLRMNAGIGRSVDRATVLERQNASLRAAVSELSSGDRIAAEAERLGYTMPAAGTTRFLDARGFDPRRAVRGITAPGEMPPLPQTAQAAQDATAATATTPAYDPVTGQPLTPTATATAGTTTTTTPATETHVAETPTQTAATGTQAEAQPTSTATSQPAGYAAPQQQTSPETHAYAPPPTGAAAATPTGTATGGATPGAR